MFFMMKSGHPFFTEVGMIKLPTRIRRAKCGYGWYLSYNNGSEMETRWYSDSEHGSELDSLRAAARDYLESVSWPMAKVHRVFEHEVCNKKKPTGKVGVVASGKRFIALAVIKWRDNKSYASLDMAIKARIHEERLYHELYSFDIVEFKNKLGLRKPRKPNPNKEVKTEEVVS
jgi:hypothetical protein